MIVVLWSFLVFQLIVSDKFVKTCFCAATDRLKIDSTAENNAMGKYQTNMSTSKELSASAGLSLKINFDSFRRWFFKVAVGASFLPQKSPFIWPLPACLNINPSSLGYQKQEKNYHSTVGSRRTKRVVLEKSKRHSFVWGHHSNPSHWNFSQSCRHRKSPGLTTTPDDINVTFPDIKISENKGKTAALIKTKLLHAWWKTAPPSADFQKSILPICTHKNHPRTCVRFYLGTPLVRRGQIYWPLAGFIRDIAIIYSCVAVTLLQCWFTRGS